MSFPGTIYGFLTSAVFAVCSAHLILLDLISQIFCEGYNLFQESLHYIFFSVFMLLCPCSKSIEERIIFCWFSIILVSSGILCPTKYKTYFANKMYWCDCVLRRTLGSRKWNFGPELKMILLWSQSKWLAIISALGGTEYLTATVLNLMLVRTCVLVV
jgi:hypothetical protein